jgi:hypothetical protein
MSDLDRDAGAEDELAINFETGFIDEGHSAKAPPSPQPDGSLLQLREILVGPLSREFEQRLGRIEQRIDRSILEFIRQTTGRIEELEQRLESRMQQLESGLAELGDGTRATVEEMRADLARQADASAEELQELGAVLTSDLEGKAAMLRGELVDRVSLSAALSEIALRLSGGAQAAGIDPSQPDLDLDELLDASSRPAAD